MFFLIRCVFWLTVVFSTIFSSDQNKPMTAPEAERPAQASQLAHSDSAAADALSARLQAWTTAALQHFWAKTGGGCIDRPAECAALAARLTDFAKQHPFKDQRPFKEQLAAEGRETVPGEARSQAAEPAKPIPLPPPRPPHLRRTAAGPAESAGS